jgi:hypothetical protein
MRSFLISRRGAIAYPSKETAALRDFDRAYDRLGSFTTDAVEATRACLSALPGTRKRTNGPTSWDVRFVP